MDYYGLPYIRSHFEFMKKLNQMTDAKAYIEKQVDYFVECCNEGEADITLKFYKMFNKYLSLKSVCKLSNVINKFGDEGTIQAFNVYLDETVGEMASV